MSVYRVLFVADTHTGSTVSPWPDGHPLPDGGTWQLSRPQRMLANFWDQMLEEALAFDHIDAVVSLGDLVDGNNPKAGLITDRMDYQAGAAVELLAPLRELAERFYVVRGTEWHTGKGDEHVTRIASDLKATPIPSTGELTWPELYLDMDGCLIHCAHHIGGTSNPMYEATAVLKALDTLILELHKAYGRLAPNVMGIVRAHRHRAISVSKNGRMGMVLAPWKLKDNHAHKVAPESIPEIGYGVMEAEDGKLSGWVRTFDLPLPHIERGA